MLPQDELRATAHAGGGIGRRGGAARYFGEKPKMWDINVVKSDDSVVGDEKWDDIKV